MVRLLQDPTGFYKHLYEYVLQSHEKTQHSSHRISQVVEANMVIGACNEFLHVCMGSDCNITAYGYPNARSDDAHVQAADKAQASAVNAMRPSHFWLVDIFPVLKYIPEWFPGATFKRVAREGRELVDDMRYGVLQWALKHYEEGCTQQSFFTRLMASYKAGDISLDIVRDDCAVFHSGESSFLEVSLIETHL